MECTSKGRNEDIDPKEYEIMQIRGSKKGIRKAGQNKTIKLK